MVPRGSRNRERKNVAKKFALMCCSNLMLTPTLKKIKIITWSSLTLDETTVTTLQNAVITKNEKSLSKQAQILSHVTVFVDVRDTILEYVPEGRIVKQYHNKDVMTELRGIFETRTIDQTRTIEKQCISSFFNRPMRLLTQ